MNRLLQDPSTLLAIILTLLTSLALLEVIGSSAVNGLILHIGWRNMMRRPGHTLLLLCGLVCSTVLITASFGLSDSLSNSVQIQRKADLGNINETVTGTFSQSQASHYLQLIQQSQQAQAVAALQSIPQRASLYNTRTGFTLDHVDTLAIPPTFDQVFGPMTDSQGHATHIADLQPGEIDISAGLAQHFDVQPGDRLTVTLSGQQFTLTAHAILSHDVMTTASDTFSLNLQQIIMPLAYYQQITHDTSLNTFAIKNATFDGDSRIQVVTNFLQQLFHVSSTSLLHTIISIPPSYKTTKVYSSTELVTFLSGEAFGTALGEEGLVQFAELLPAFTGLLVGAGLLLVALLFILLAAERRSELGMSRAIGMQRFHLVQALLTEGCGYGIIACLVGIPLGIGACMLELFTLSHVPLQGTFGTGASLSFYFWISWQHVVQSGCIEMLTTFAVVLATAIWISRLNIVAAIRDLEEPLVPMIPLANILKALVGSYRDAEGQLIPETSWHKIARRSDTVGILLRGLFLRGPLCLLLGAGLFLGEIWLQLQSPNGRFGWMTDLGIVLLIAGGGLLISWMLALCKVPTTLVSRLRFSLIGAGWLVYELQPSGYFLSLFRPAGTHLEINTGRTPEIILSSVVLIVGTVLFIMANADLLVALLNQFTLRLRSLAPIGRTSLSYPLTFRGRTTATVSLLSLVVFLTILLLTINVGSIQQADTTANSGGFQLQMNNLPASTEPLFQSNPILHQDIAVAGSAQNVVGGYINVLIPGHASQKVFDDVSAMNDAFLDHTLLPVQAKAQGYSTDRQIWDAVKNHSDLAVWRYDTNIQGISPNIDGFQPFPVEVTNKAGLTQRFTVIGIVSPNSQWPFLYVSTRSASTLVDTNSPSRLLTYFLRLNAGVSEQKVSRDLLTAFGSEYKATLQQLTANANTATISGLTAFLESYLALGLLFGALSIGIITSRSVIERRQQIGMLRAIGFSRGLVLRSFLLEAGLVITLSLAGGTTLGLWTAYQITHTLYPDFFVPFPQLALILLGSYLITFISSSLPARKAAHVLPAEALRYE